MSFVKYQNTNNASSLLIADITASQTTILITDGDQGLFPSSFPFLLTIEHLDASENVILREIVKVVSSNQNSFTVERSAGICVQDDTATNRVQDNTAHAFYSGDKISLYWTAEQVADIQNNLELKANQDSIANVYDSSLTYAIGDIVVYNGDRYICQTAVETPEEFDPTKWTKVNVQYTLDDQQTQIDTINTEIAGLGAPNKVDIFVLGGGGAGGGTGATFSMGGGGGAGGLVEKYGFMIRSKTQQVIIGAGGNGHACLPGENGCPSKFGNIVAEGGGGGGGAFGSCWECRAGRNGANGGGGAGQCGFTNCIYLHGGYPTVKGGNPGFSGGTGSNYQNGGGGGGVGGNPNLIFFYTTNIPFRHVGGIGIATCFGGTLRCLGGGGGLLGGTMGEIGGVCFGGGLTGTTNNSVGGNATANTGGGGGGANSIGGAFNNAGGNGGSGLVMVRYPTDCSYGIKTATGGTITTATIDGIEYKVHTFTSSGTFEITESV